MSEPVIASSEPDATAAEVDVQHHATTTGAPRPRTEAFLGDVAGSAERDDANAGCGGHTCSCGEVDGAGYPELDVRSIPHSIRHATVFGALESLRPGAGLELVAPHDPLPLLEQVDQRWPGAFSVSYDERGPEAWRLSLVRGDE